MNLPKSLKFLGNFCTGVKRCHFSIVIIYGQLLQTFADFFWSHCCHNTRLGVNQNKVPETWSYQKDFLKWAITSLFFFIFVFSKQLTVHKCSTYKSLTMTGFEPWTSGVGSIFSTN